MSNTERGKQLNSPVGRVAFTTRREIEFFTESELTTQIGYRKDLWPLVMVKELIDNAIDACETAAARPIKVGVQLDKDFITVSDNGPGISHKVVKGVLDYSVRVSDKKYYIAPTRGQLGNALKCVVAAAFGATGRKSVIEVVARGLRHRIEVQADRIAQVPKITYATSKGSRGIGTILKIHWPEISSYLRSNLHDLYQFSDLNEAIKVLIGDFAAFNPHVAFAFNRVRRAATAPDWRKWLTDQPTSAHWYRPDDLRALIAAHINERDMPVRDFVANFAGLARTDVRSDVLAVAKLGGSYLSDLVRDGDVDMKKAERLLAAMRDHSKPVQPNRLGVIGQDHLSRYFESLGAQNFKYYKKMFIDDEGLPVVVEIAFGTKICAAQTARRIFGLNWSPVLRVPSGEIGEAINNCLIQNDDPVIYLVHAARPRFDFLDHGKGAIA